MSVQYKTDYLQEMFEMKNKLFEINYTFWIEHVLFSFNWWFLIIITILPWSIWWRFVDKKRIIEILLMGMLVMITSVFLDVVGTSFLLWDYAYKDIQMIPILIPVDVTIVPIVYMFVYQIFLKWKSYIFSLTVASIVAAFIVEKLIVWMGIYILYRWEHLYSFFIYFAMGIVFKWIIEKMKERQAKGT